jgi:acetyl-CoA carboxylase biotin carboxyl carrier protein
LQTTEEALLQQAIHDGEWKMASTVKTEDIEALVELFEASDWDELHLKIDGLELFLSNDPNSRLAPLAAHSAASHAAASVPHAQQPSPQGMGHVVPPPAQAAPISAVPAHWVAVKAPNLGTFYRAPKPGAPPYVELGQAVSQETEVCLIEVMKLFTAVCAGTKGIIRRILVNDAEMVEFGQTLFYIEPA